MITFRVISPARNDQYIHHMEQEYEFHSFENLKAIVAFYDKHGVEYYVYPPTEQEILTNAEQTDVWDQAILGECLESTWEEAYEIIDYLRAKGFEEDV